MEYQDTQWRPNGMAGGYISAQNADVAYQRQQQDLERYGLENIMKQQAAQQAQQEMGNPEYNQARLAGLIGQSNSLSAKGQFDTQTLDPRIHASVAENYAKANDSEIAQKRANLNDFINSYEANQGNPAYTLDGITDPAAKQRLAQQAGQIGLPAVYQQAKAMRNSLVALDADSGKFRNQKQLADEAHTSNEKIAAGNNATQMSWHEAQNAERLDAARIRAEAIASKKKEQIAKLSRPLTDSTLYNEQQTMESINPDFKKLDVGAKKQAIQDVYFRAKDLVVKNQGNPDYSEEDAFNEARDSVMNELKVTTEWGGLSKNVTRVKTPIAPQGFAPSAPQEQKPITFIPDQGYEPTQQHALILQKAMDAIKAGKDPAGVNQKLRANGILVNLQ